MRFKCHFTTFKSQTHTYRVEVGKIETTDDMSDVEATLANEMYPAANMRVAIESFAQYRPSTLNPEINKLSTIGNNMRTSCKIF